MVKMMFLVAAAEEIQRGKEGDEDEEMRVLWSLVWGKGVKGWAAAAAWLLQWPVYTDTTSIGIPKLSVSVY